MNSLQPSSGTQNFDPAIGDMVLEAFSRIQIRPPALVRDHFYQARLSAQFMLSEWANLAMPELFQLQLLQVPLLPGQATYTLQRSIIAPLDAFIRVYQMANSRSFAPSFTAATLSTSMTVGLPAHSLAPGQAIWWPMPIAASGVLIQGPYLVTSVVDQNTFEITLPTQADGTNSVALPTYTTMAGSSIVTVTLPEHGLSAGQIWYDNLGTTAGGILLNGGFTVTSVLSPSVFTIQAPQAAISNQSIVMNSGQAQLQTQAFGVDPIDYILYPVSRTEYATQPDKGLQYRPTTFWANRVNPLQITFWNEPDNGVYVFNLWAMVQNDDIVLEGGVGTGVPFRWLDAFAAGMARRLCRKFPPPASSGITIADLKGEYDEAVTLAMKEDIERGPAFYLTPGVAGYWRA